MIGNTLSQLLETIAQTAKKAGRAPEEIKLVAVSKTVDFDLMQEAMGHGQILFGENYLQEAASKIARFPPTVDWHFIGHLQSNKVKQAVDLFNVIETVDRWKIAEAVDSHAKMLNKKMSILLQVNIGREKQKSGVVPEEAEVLLQQIAQKTDLSVLGLMTLPPFFSDPEKSRPYYRELRHLAQQLTGRNLFADDAHVALSMGMSNDFHVAIEEGATFVRIGTALFGERNI